MVEITGPIWQQFLNGHKRDLKQSASISQATAPKTEAWNSAKAKKSWSRAKRDHAMSCLVFTNRPVWGHQHWTHTYIHTVCRYGRMRSQQGNETSLLYTFTGSKVGQNTDRVRIDYHHCSIQIQRQHERQLWLEETKQTWNGVHLPDQSASVETISYRLKVKEFEHPELTSNLQLQRHCYVPYTFVHLPCVRVKRYPHKQSNNSQLKLRFANIRQLIDKDGNQICTDTVAKCCKCCKMWPLGLVACYIRPPCWEWSVCGTALSEKMQAGAARGDSQQPNPQSRLLLATNATNTNHS